MGACLWYSRYDSPNASTICRSRHQDDHQERQAPHTNVHPITALLVHAKGTVPVNGYSAGEMLDRFSRIELPMTDRELAVMAMTPIIGCSRPIAAMGMAARL